jgi:hypothetical protein
MSAADAEAELSEIEEAGLELIRSSGGIYQSEFWKELEISSRKGSRIASTLAEAELIERERAVHDGHTTYLLSPAARDLEFELLMAGTCCHRSSVRRRSTPRATRSRSG